MKPSLLFLGWLILELGSSLSAQNDPRIEAAPRSDRGIYSLCHEISPHGWFHFKPQAQVALDTLFDQFGHQLGLSAFDQMVEIRNLTDSQGIIHRRYQQHHRGLPVEGAYFTLHGHADQVQLAHGQLAPNLNISPLPTLPPTQARQKLLAHLSEAYLAYQDAQWEADLRRDLGDSSATWLPQAELEIMALRQGQSQTYLLAYRFEVRSLKPDRYETIWLDAHQGKLLRRRSLRHQCRSVAGTAQLHFYGEQTLFLRDRDFPNYDYSLESCEDQAIHTKYFSLNSFGEPRSWGWISNIDHHRAHWGQRDARATTAHWAAQQAWQYFAEHHDWYGPDDRGGHLRILVDWQPPAGNPGNVAWYQAEGDRHYLYLGRQGELPMASLDLVGHEYAHAIIRTASDLSYERESGALHEALADILGTLVEASQSPNGLDWVMAQEVGGLRSLARPADYAQPSTYLTDPLWVSTEASACEEPSSEPAPLGNDNCGIHTNSGVVNHWFYLLATGGQQNGVQVSGIGLKATADLVFQMIRYYLDPTSDFLDARSASIQAASDLYGACSNQIAQVRNAWGAVGVGRANDLLCVQISGPAQICVDQAGEESTFEAKAAAGADFVWGPLPPGVDHYVTGPQQQFLVIRGLADSVSSVSLSVQARLDSQQANQTMTVLPAFCKNHSSRTGEPLPVQVRTWTAYPNPTQGILEIFVQEGHYPGNLTVCDPLGRRLIEQPVSNNNFVMDLSSLRPGRYYLWLDGPRGRQARIIELQP